MSLKLAPPPPADVDEIRRTLSLLISPGAVAELRVLKVPRLGTVSGYYDDPEKMARDAAYWSGRAAGVYTTLNPCDPSLLARACNRMQERAEVTTSDANIAARRWLPVDVDPQRPAGISSTDLEHRSAITRAKEIADWMRAQGWPRPILASSGNGGHLLIPIDMPNDADTTRVIERCLQTLAANFNGDGLTVDTSIFNPSRIWKVYGTVACKGDNTPDRPHRLARLLEVPR